MRFESNLAEPVGDVTPAADRAPRGLRTLIVSSCYPPHGWGGAEVAAEGIARWLLAHGHDVAVYTDHEAPRDAAEGDVHAPEKPRWLHRAHEHGRQSGSKKMLWHAVDHLPWQGAEEFGRVARTFAPDVVMVHLVPGLGLGIFDYCARHDLPVVFVLHDFWLTCLRSSMFSNGQTCAKREGLCRVSSMMRWRALARVKRLGFWAPSQRIVEIIRGELGDIFPRLLLERYVVDLADFRGGEPYLPAQRPRLLYAGKVTAAKGVDFLLDCLAGLPRELEFEIDILGGGDRLAALQARFAGDGRFRFHGVADRSRVADFYRRATLLLVPSLWFENSPLVIYQAQAAGLPVIGSDSGGIPDLLSHQARSLVLPAGNHEAWSKALTTLLADRPGLAAGKNEALTAARDAGLTIDARGRRIVDFCRSVIGVRPGGHSA